MDWTRFAIYWLPGGALGRAGAGWLGWDARTGRAGPGDPVAAPPRRYGFHATLQPPFRLAGDATALEAAVGALADGLAPVPPQPLAVTPTGRFLAIRPADDRPARALAAALVASLDAFRAPPPPEEIARRRTVGLTPAQDALLTRWGYPFVMDEHRLHLTLSGPNPSAEAAARARAHFGEVLATPVGIDAVALTGEDAKGRFHLIREMPLRGHGGSA